MKWKTKKPNIDDAGLMIVNLDSGKKEMYLAQIDNDGDLVDPEYGDTLGWNYSCVDRWISFEEIERDAFNEFELRFREDQAVTVDGWFGIENRKGEIAKDCFKSEGTALVVFDDCDRGCWVPVKHILVPIKETRGNQPRRSE